MKPRTLYEKLWDAHAVVDLGDGEWLLYIDRHLVHEGTSPQAFDGLRAAGRRVRRPSLTFAVADHNVPTERRAAGLAGIRDPASRTQVQTLERNAQEFGIPYAALEGGDHGIVHVIGPELGLTLPGTTIACGDSHTPTHGALGALAYGIGTSDVEHVLATQTLLQKRSRSMLVRIDGTLGYGVTPKDLVLALIGRIGATGGAGHVMEFGGEAVAAMDMAGRMTLCNMAVEAGARSALIAPDDTCFAWIEGRPRAPAGADFDRAVAHWRTLASDEGAAYDRVVALAAGEVAPMVTWGTSPEAVATVAGAVPDPAAESDPSRIAQIERMLSYMDLAPGQKLAGLAIDAVFIGSCTNSRIEDLRAAAAVARGRSVAPGVRALVVPGSAAVKRQAEAEGLDRIFIAAGFQWRDSGCSMCLGLNPDRLAPGERCASTSNRNFEGRQGPGGRTHLMSPPMAAAAAVSGRIVDVRELGR